MKNRLFFPIGVLFLMKMAMAANDTAVSPNQIQTTPGKKPEAKVVAVPQPVQTPDAGTLSPQNMSQMGMGVQIPLGGAQPPAPADKTTDEEATPQSGQK